MHKYLVTSTTTTLPWLHPVLNLFFNNVLKIAAHGVQNISMDVKFPPVLNIIAAIKFKSLQLIQLALEKMSIGFPINSP